jgi:hypothetical protein
MIRARAAAAAVTVVALCAAMPARAQLYTTYNFTPTQVSWITCGSTQGSEGCYGSGSLNGYGHLCAVLEDNDISKSGSYNSKQRLYFMDNNATGNNDVALHVLEKKITVSDNYATTTFTKVDDVALPLTDGAACQIAANKVVILAGTTQSTNAAYIVKKTLAASSYGGFSPPEQVTSITSDAAGYISVNFAGSPFTGFYLIGPNGEGEEDGGGNAYVIPKDNGLILP